MFRIYRDLFRLIIAKDEEKLKAKEAKARAKAEKKPWWKMFLQEHLAQGKDQVQGNS